MNTQVHDAPVIPGLVLLAETGRDAVARRFRVQAERPITLYWFADSARAPAIVAQAEAFARIGPTGFAPMLKAFVHDGRAGVLLGCERAEDAFDGPVIGEDATLLAIRPIVAGLGEIAAAGSSHGRLSRALARQHDGSWIALPAFTVAADPKESAGDATRRDVGAIVELVVHAICGVRPAGAQELPAEFARLASPRLLATVKKILDATRAGDGLTELLGSYLAPRQAAAAKGSASVAADRAQRRGVFTALAIAAPIALLAVMAATGRLERVKEFLRFEDAPAPQAGRSAVPVESNAPEPPPIAPPPSAPPAVDDSEQTRALAEKILSDIRASVKPAPAAPARDPELIAAEELEAEGKKLLLDLREKKVAADKRAETLATAIEKLETARSKYQTLSEQSPTLKRQLDVVVEDLTALLFHAYRLKTRD